MAYGIGRNIALERNKADFLGNWNYFSSSIHIKISKIDSLHLADYAVSCML